MSLGQKTFGGAAPILELDNISTLDSNVFVGQRAGNSNANQGGNVFIGQSSGQNNIAGTQNVFIGQSSGKNNVNANQNVFIGTNSGENNTLGNDNVFLGNSSGKLNKFGSNNVFLGNNSGINNTSGNCNVFIGNYSGGENSNGNENVFIGNYSGFSNSTGSNNVFLGNHCGKFNFTGNDNVFIGYRCGESNVGGSYNVFLGHQSGMNNTGGNYNLFLGYRTGMNNTDGHSNVAIGINTEVSSTNNIGNSGSQNTMLGINAGLANNGNSNVFIGVDSGMHNNSGNNNTFLGTSSGKSNTDGSDNVFIGQNSGFNAQNSLSNIFIGNNTGHSASGSNNVFLGTNSGHSSKGDENVFVGTESGHHNTEGKYNVFLGYNSGYGNTTGNFNTFVGYKTGEQNKTSSELNLIFWWELKHDTNDNSNNSNNGTINGSISFNDTNETLSLNLFGVDILLNIDKYAFVSNYITSQSFTLTNIDNGYTLYEITSMDGDSPIYGNSYNFKYHNWATSFFYKANNSVSYNKLFTLHPDDNISNVEIYHSGQNIYYTITAKHNLYNTTKTFTITHNNSNIDKWNHYIFQYEGQLGKMSMYINGILVESTAFLIINEEESLGQPDGLSSNNVFTNYPQTHTFSVDFNGYVQFNSHSGNFKDIRFFDSIFEQNDVSGFFLNASYNVFIGYLSGSENINGFNNVFLGTNCGSTNKNGNNNVFIGLGNSYNNHDGNNNVIIGKEGNFNNTAGNENVILGSEAGRNNTLGSQNVFAGYQSGYNNYGHYNVNLGNFSGYNNKGNRNIFCGFNSGKNNVIGFENVFLGYNSGMNNNGILSSKLILWYRFEKQVNTIYDSSSRNNHGEIYDTPIKRGLENTYVDGVKGDYGLRLGGTSTTPFVGNFIKTNANIDLNNKDFTISFWYKYDYSIDVGKSPNKFGWKYSRTPGICGQINKNKSSINDNDYLRIFFQAGDLAVTFGTNTYATSYNSTIASNRLQHVLDSPLGEQSRANPDFWILPYDPSNSNTWYHFTIVFNNSTKQLKFFRNKSLYHSTTYNQTLNIPPDNDNQHFYIGSAGNDGIYDPTNKSGTANGQGPQFGRNPILGFIDDFKIFEYSLSDEEVENMYLYSCKNVFVGNNAGQYNTTGYNNTFIGDQSGQSNDNGINNTFIGKNSGLFNQGNNNVFIGNDVGKDNTNGFNNTCIGFSAASQLTNGFSNIYVGSYAGQNATNSINNVCMGVNSGKFLNGGSNNVFLGHNTGEYNAIGSYNVFLGYESGQHNVSGNNNVFLGYRTGACNIDGNANVFLGYRSGELNENGSSNIYLGVNAGRRYTGSSNIVLGIEDDNLTGSVSGDGNVNIAGSGGVSDLDGSTSSGDSNTFLGIGAGVVNNGSLNTFVGTAAGASNNQGNNNTFIGTSAGEKNTEGDDNVFLGVNAGQNNTSGNTNVFIGKDAGRDNTGAGSNVFIGFGAGLSNIGDSGSSDRNVFIGTFAGAENTGGQDNVFLGTNAGKLNFNGNNNVFLGNGAGISNTNFSNNVCIGFNAGIKVNTDNNVCIGTNAGANNTVGTQNTVLGNGAASGDNFGGSYNIVCGFNSGKNVLNDNNIIFGTNAGNDDVVGNIPLISKTVNENKFSDTFESDPDGTYILYNNSYYNTTSAGADTVASGETPIVLDVNTSPSVDITTKFFNLYDNSNNIIQSNLKIYQEVDTVNSITSPLYYLDGNGLPIIVYYPFKERFEYEGFLLSQDTFGQYEQKETFLQGNYIKYGEAYYRYTLGEDYTYEQNVDVNTGNSTLIIKIPVNVYALTYFPTHTPSVSTTHTLTPSITPSPTLSPNKFPGTPTVTTTATPTQTTTTSPLPYYPTPTVSPTVTATNTTTQSPSPTPTQTTRSYYWAFNYEFDDSVTSNFAYCLCFNIYTAQPNIGVSTNSLQDPDGYYIFNTGHYPEAYHEHANNTVDTNYGLVTDYDIIHRGTYHLPNKIITVGGGYRNDFTSDFSVHYYDLRDSASFLVYTLDNFINIPYIRMGFTQGNYPSKINIYKSESPIDYNNIVYWKLNAKKYQIPFSSYTFTSNNFKWWHSYEVTWSADIKSGTYQERIGNIYEFDFNDAVEVPTYVIPVPSIISSPYYYAFTLLNEDNTNSNTLGFQAYSFEPLFNNPTEPEGTFQDDYNLKLLNSTNTIHSNNSINSYYYFDYVASTGSNDRATIETILDEASQTYLYTTEAFTSLNSIRIALTTCFSSGGGSEQYAVVNDPNKNAETAIFPSKIIIYKNSVPFNSMSTAKWLESATGVSLDFNDYVNKTESTAYQIYRYRLEHWPNPRTYNVTFCKNFDYNLSDAVPYSAPSGGGGGGDGNTGITNINTLFYSNNAVDLNSYNVSYLLDINFEENLPYGTGGNNMYVLDYYTGIQQIELSTPWDITSTLTRVSSLPLSQGWKGFTFNYDGSILYVGLQIRAGYNVVYKYLLSTPWDLSTATLDSSNYITDWTSRIQYHKFEDTETLYLCGNYTIAEYTTDFTKIKSTDLLSLIQSYNLNGLNTYPYILAFQFNLTGSKLHTVHHYNFNNISGYIIIEHVTSSPFDISTLSYSTNTVFTEVPIFMGMTFKQYDRTKLFVVNRLSNADATYPYHVFEYTLDGDGSANSIPSINLSILQYTGNIISTTVFPGQSETQPSSVFIKDATTASEVSGDKLYITGYQREKLLEFSLSIPYSIAGSVNDIYSKKVGVQPKSITFDYTGSTFYVLSENSLIINTLSSPWTLEAGSTVVTKSLTYGAENYLNGIDYSFDGETDYIYLIDSHPTGNNNGFPGFCISRLNLSDDSITYSVDIRTIANMPDTIMLPIDVCIHRGGEYILVLDKANSKIIQISMSVNWDVTSTLTYVNHFDFSEFHTSAEGFYVNRYDSSSVFIIDSIADQIFEYIVFDGVISNFYIYLESTNSYTTGNFPIKDNLTDSEQSALLHYSQINRAFIHDEDIPFFFVSLYGREIDIYTYNQVYGSASAGLYEAGGFYTIDSSGIPIEFFPTRDLNYYKLDELSDGTAILPESHFGLDVSGNYKIINLRTLKQKTKTESEFNSLTLVSTKSFTDIKYVQPKFNFGSALFIPIYELPESNIVLGTNAGRQISDIENSVILGTQAGEFSSGRQNVNVGNLAGQYSNGINNVYIGTLNGKDLVGSFNVIVGSQSASTLGFSSFSVLIGSFLDTPPSDNYLAIGNGSNPLITGNFNDRNLFINGNLFVNGNSKTFVINHPTKENKYLVHACLEGPENAVFYRGHITTEKNHGLGILPEYFSALVHHNSVTVQLTPIKELANVCLMDIDFDNNLFYIKTNIDCKVAYHIMATRKDIADLVFEVDCVVPVRGDGPYTYI